VSDRPENPFRYDDLARQYERRPPVCVTPLDYYGKAPGEAESPVPVGVQFILGFLMPFCYIALIMATGVGRDLELIWVHCFVFAIVAGVVSRWLKWKGLNAGLITGILVIPVAVFVLCCIALSRI
jgi:hypothetical protein